MNKLRSIFFPTNEEKIKLYESIIAAHMGCVGKCVTCTNYNPPPADLPGFVEDRGECGLNKDIFLKKICAAYEEVIPCESYEEDAASVVTLTIEIERLKGE